MFGLTTVPGSSITSNMFKPVVSIPLIIERSVPDTIPVLETKLPPFTYKPFPIRVVPLDSKSKISGSLVFVVWIPTFPEPSTINLVESGFVSSVITRALPVPSWLIVRASAEDVDSIPIVVIPRLLIPLVTFSVSVTTPILVVLVLSTFKFPPISALLSNWAFPCTSKLKDVSWPSTRNPSLNLDILATSSLYSGCVLPRPTAPWLVTTTQLTNGLTGSVINRAGPGPLCCNVTNCVLVNPLIVVNPTVPSETYPVPPTLKVLTSAKPPSTSIEVDAIPVKFPKKPPTEVVTPLTRRFS